MTTIAWTGKTWNPIKAVDVASGKVGWFCEKVSPGCEHCYAETFNRFRGNGHKYAVRDAKALRFELDDRTAIAAARWTKSWRVFPCSMTDLFLRHHTLEQLDRIHAVMAFARQQTFQVLTKRPEAAAEYYAGLFEMGPGARDRWDDARQWLIEQLRVRATPRKRAELQFQQKIEYIGVMMADTWRAPLPNLWLGTTVEDRKRADERVSELLRIKAAVHWVSFEPALEAVDFTNVGDDRSDYRLNALTGAERYVEQSVPRKHLAKLDWIVVGGESGGGARGFAIQWARKTVADCRAASVAVFVKQLGKKPYDLSRSLTDDPTSIYLTHPKGEDPAEWPEDLRVREYPDRPIIR